MTGGNIQTITHVVEIQTGYSFRDRVGPSRGAHPTSTLDTPFPGYVSGLCERFRLFIYYLSTGLGGKKGENE